MVDEIITPPLSPEELAIVLEANRIKEEERLIREEDERVEKIRQQDLLSRFNSLYDKRAACVGITNPDAYFRDHISQNPNHSEAESLLVSIEGEDSRFKQSSFIDSEQQKLIDLRKVRDSYLDSTDRTQIADYPLDSAGKSSYRDYRSYLRDIPLALSESRSVSYHVMSYDEYLAALI